MLRKRYLTVAILVTVGIQVQNVLAWLVRSPVPRTTRHRMAADQVTPTKRVAIAGGGPAGSLMGIYLARTGGFKVDIFEASTPEVITDPSNRAHNIVFMKRGLDALREGGVDLVEEGGHAAVQLTGGLRHGAQSSKETNAFKEDCISMRRGDVAVVLMNKAASYPNIEVHTGMKLESVDLDSRIAKFGGGKEGESIEYAYDMLVGADGVNSRVRAELEAKAPEFTVEQREDFMAYKTIIVPTLGMEGATDGWKTKFHVYNSKIGCLLSPPRSDGKMTTICTLPSDGPNSFQSLMKSTSDVRAFFTKWYPRLFADAEISEEVARDFLEKRPQRLKTTICSRQASGNVVLIGDAAHSMWASLGQGVQAALEDCKILAQLLQTSNPGGVLDIPKVLQTYSEQRSEDMKAVCLLSEEGFGGGRSMRPAFMAQLVVFTLLNKTIGRLAPKTFTPPSITRISDAGTPYSEIWRDQLREAQILRRAKYVAAAGAAAALALAARSFRFLA